MNTNELTSRQRKALNLTVRAVEGGYAVPSSDGGEYTISRDEDGRLVCQCIDFAIHKADKEWQCKHVLAVMLFIRKSGRTDPPSQEPVRKRASRYDAIDLS